MKANDVQTEIQQAVVALSLPAEQFRLLSGAEGEAIYRACLAEFVTASFVPRWWWEYFREPHAHYDPPPGILGSALLPALVPDAAAPCFFIAEDDDAPFYPVYLSTPRIASRILGECFAFEYYITPLDLSWILCEDHHDRIHGVGEPIVQILNAQP